MFKPQLVYNRYFFLTEKNQPACLSVGEFGCFKTKFSSPFGEKFAISPLEDKDCWLLTKPSLNRDQAFERCSWCSWKKGFFLFGLDGKGNCYAGTLLHIT